MAGAADRVGFPHGNQGDQILRAGRRAQAAAQAPVLQNHRHAVSYLDGIMGTGRRAGAKAQAAAGAGSCRYTGKGRGPAVPDAHISKGLGRLFTAAGAADESHPAGGSLGLHAHHLADGLDGIAGAHRAGTHSRFSLDDGSCHGVTAGKAAGAAVVAGKQGPDLGFPLVNLHMELLSRRHQGNADDEADHCHNGSGNQHSTHTASSFTGCR